MKNRASINHRLSDYVVIISAHNVAELLACLHFKPLRLFTIATFYYKPQERRFIQVLKNRCPEIEIIPLNTQVLQGELINESYLWASKQLSSRLCTEHQKILNATGGTKALILGLEKAIPWNEIHYKGYTSKQLEVLRLRHGGDINAEIDTTQFVSYSSELYLTLSVDDICQLYIENINPDRTSVYTPGKQALTLAKEIGHCKETGIQFHPHRIIAEFIDNVLSNKNLKPTAKWATLCKDANHRRSLKEWCQRLHLELPELFKLTDDEVQINKKFKRNELGDGQLRWLSGGWLEQLTLDWLKECGLSERHIHAGLFIQSDNIGNAPQGSEREIDFCVFFNEKLYLLEVKAGVPTRRDLTLAERQLSSLEAIFPSSTKILLLGPWAEDKFQNDRDREEFLAQCRGSRIQVVFNRKEMQRLFDKQV